MIPPAARLLAALFLASTFLGCRGRGAPGPEPAGGPEGAKAGGKAPSGRIEPLPGERFLRGPADDCGRSTTPFAQPIAVVEDVGISRHPPVLSFPIAFSKDAGVHSLTGFTATTLEGQPLPTQLEVLSRWSGAPSDCGAPIRWAYAHVAARVAPGARAYLGLRHDPETPVEAARPAGAGSTDGKARRAAPEAGTTVGPRLALEEESGAIRVDTGPARFTIDTQRFTGISKVELRAGAGFEALVNLARQEDAGLLIDRDGGPISTAFAQISRVEVERRGPVVATIAVHGAYARKKGERVFRATTRLSFYAGTGVVLFDHTYYNGETADFTAHGGKNRAKVDRVYLRLPVDLGPSPEVLARAAERVFRLRPRGLVSVAQDKRTPDRAAVVFSVREGEATLEVGTFAERPLIAAVGAGRYAAATLGSMSVRDPQALRFDPGASGARSVAERHGVGSAEFTSAGYPGASGARSVAERHGVGSAEFTSAGYPGASGARSVAERHGVGSAEFTSAGYPGASGARSVAERHGVGSAEFTSAGYPGMGAIEVDFQSEAVFIGGARGIWSKAVLDFGLAPPDLDLLARGDALYAHATRPLIAAPSMAYLNTTRARPALPTGELPDDFSSFDARVDVIHDGTARFLRTNRITGSQLWPDLPRRACEGGACAELETGYFEGGDCNYWDWSLVELEAFLRTADPSFLHDFALPEAITMAETVSFRPDPRPREPAAGAGPESSFAGFSPCYGGGSGDDGVWQEGLNHRRGACPGDYSYNKVHQLAYVLTGDRRFTDFFAQGAATATRLYKDPTRTKPDPWLELSASRTAYQYLELLLDAAEFARDPEDNRRFRQRARQYFDHMRGTALERGHTCNLLGSGRDDPKLAGTCLSDQAWMLPVWADWVARLERLEAHAPAHDWLLELGRMSAARYTVTDDRGHPDFSKREGTPGWRTMYRCLATRGGVRDDTCEKFTQVENEGRFYANGLVAFLNVYGVILDADPSDPLQICSWLPAAYASALEALEREAQEPVWGKALGQAYAFTQTTLGALERCPR